jgi:hypothetical protein
MVRRPIRNIFMPRLEVLEPRLAPSVDVLTYHNNVPGNNSGANLNETQLTPANVNVNTFGKFFTYPVDGQVYGQPLVKTGVSIPGQGTHDVVYVVTQHDSVYAFDANSNAGANGGLFWHDSFLTSGLPGASAITPVPNGVTGSGDILPEIGITATPTIDPTSGTLYIVSKTQETVSGVNHYVQRLHALDITTGAEKFGGPVLIGDTTFGGTDAGFTNVTPIALPGTGDGSDGTTVRFNALRENERDGLFLSGGVLYLSYTSHGDVFPYHGWLLGYNPATLQLVSIYNTTPNGGLGAIWMGGGSPAVDANGFIYFATGNGTFDAAGGGPLALGPSGGGLGYGPDHTGGQGGISNSVAIKFDLFQNVSEGVNSTGIFTDGRSPTVRDPSLPPNPTPTLPDISVDLTGSGIDLHSQHVMQVTLSYNGTILTESIKDTTLGIVKTVSYAVDIPTIVGGNTAFVGFTGGTGGLTAVQDVQTWTFSNGGTTTIDHSAGFANHSDLTNNGSAFYNGTAARLTDGGGGEAGSVFSNAQVNVANFTTTFTFLQAPGTNPTADGMTFTIENATHGPDYAMSTEKLSPTAQANGQLPVLSFFTPHDEASLSGVDLDQGSGGVLLLPAAAGSAAHPNLLVQTGKTGRIYLLDRDNLGGFTATDSGAVQVLPDGTINGGSYDTPAYFNNGTQQLIYYLGAGDVLKSFTVANGQLSTQPFAETTQVFGFPGATPAISANGTSNGIVWALDDHLNGTEGHPNSGPAVLHAYDATTLTELYNSSQLGTLDQLGDAVKFTTPTVANGKVYVGTQGSNGTMGAVTVFGLFPAPTSVPAAPTELSATATGPNSIVLNWTNNATNARANKIFRSTGDASNLVQISLVSEGSTTFTDTTVTPATKYFYEVVATNALGDSGPSNLANDRTQTGPPALRITGTGSSQVNLAWTPTAGTHYNVLRSTDGVNFSVIANLSSNDTTFVDTGLAPNVYHYKVEAFGQNSETAFSNVVRDTVGEPVVLDHSNGFASHTDLTTNGSARFFNAGPPFGTVALLTDGGFSEAGTMFSDQKLDVRSFTTTFTFAFVGGTNPIADGMTFVIQGNSSTALGGGGGGLGYSGIPNSVAVTFRAFTSTQIGLGVNGSFLGQVPITGIDFNAAAHASNVEPFQVTIQYDGTTLNATIKDLITGVSFTAPSQTINIPSLVGGDMAYAGFSAGTGGLATTAAVGTWKFTPTTQNFPPLSPSNLKVASIDPHDANTTDVNVVWTTNSFNETGYEVWRSTDGKTFTQIATLPPNSMSFTDSKLGAGTYFYKARAFNANGESLFSNLDSVIIGQPGATVTAVDHSAGFTNHSDLTANGSASFFPNSDPVGTFLGHQDIGAVAAHGSATFDPGTGTYAVQASGSDIWDVADSFQFVYKPLVGDGEIVARAVHIDPTDFWAKGGVMMRESLDANSRDAFTLETPNVGGGFHNEPVFQWRTDPGGFTSDSDNHIMTEPPAPIWLRLVRSGNNFSGFWALDVNNGQSHGPWNQLGPTVTVNMAQTIFVGLALTAHNNSGVLNTSTFDHVTITGTTAPLPLAVARLTDGGGGEAGSVFTTSRVTVANFNTTFTFRMHDGTTPSADGMTFVIQSNSPTALGFTGGGLGYGSDTPNGPQGIPNSIAIKFDLFNNAGEGVNSTGLFTNGASPTVGVNPGDSSIDLTGTGIDLHSQDVFKVTLSYSGTTLTETITDTATNATFTHAYTVDIAAHLGGSLGYVGFTGGTGGLTTVADVQTWTYQFTEPSPGGGGGSSPSAQVGSGGSSGAGTPGQTPGDGGPSGILLGGSGLGGSTAWGGAPTAGSGGGSGVSAPPADLVFGTPGLLDSLGGTVAAPRPVDGGGSETVDALFASILSDPDPLRVI